MNAITFEQIPNELMNCMMKTEGYVNKLSFIDYSCLELLRYYVSYLNGCAYCVDMHYKEAIAAGETQQRLYSVALWRDTHFYTDKEKVFLEWAEYVTQLKYTPEEHEAIFKKLKMHLSIEEIANLTLVIVQINSWNRLAKPFNFEAGVYEVREN